METTEKDIQHLSIQQALELLCRRYPGQVAFSTSLGEEDQVLTDIIFRNNLPVKVFTLDTGRLFNETYDLIQITEAKYGKRIEVVFPEAKEVEQLVSQHGINCFYESVELRKKCCAIRKVHPLKRALEGMKIWITGLRAAQSENRHELSLLAWDNGYQLLKYNPLLNWSLQDVEKYLEQNNVPFNPLHRKGFVSIGCAPCTRAIAEGEDIRAGRWWWEDSKKECGLHEQPVNYQI
ncbi:MAG: phosphoadenylyl-sulfate reductase [Chitinophagales bacterium]|nr:phosphoadenylyl-sulfate reductase [Chitinophagales bacterium]